MANDVPDYYKILQIERFSHINTIKKQYKKLALTLHPDKNPDTVSEDAFKVVNEAFSVLSDKIRRKEYDVKLRIAMQSALLAEGTETTSFWTKCSSCGLVHQFERKYLGHNLMCPSCKESFVAIEVEDKNDDDNNIPSVIPEVGSEEGKEAVSHRPSAQDGEYVGGDEGLMGTRVSARIKARKIGNFGFSRKRVLGGKRKMGRVGVVSKRSSGKMTRSVDEIGLGTEVEREKVRNVDMKGDVESDNGLIKGLRLRTKGKVRSVGEGEDTMTLAEMQMLVKKKVNKEKIPVKDKGEEKEENEKAMKVSLMEKESEKRKEVDLSLIEKEDDVEMETLIARVREKRMRRSKGSRQDDSEITAENEKAMKFNSMEKETEKRKELDLSLVEEEDEVEMETLIARVREKRMRRGTLKGDGGRRRDFSSKMSSKGLRQDDSEIMAENGKEESEKAMTFNLMEKDCEKRKETNLSLVEEEDEGEMEMLIARVREKRMKRETLKGDGGRRDLSSKRCGKGSTQDDSEIMAENEKAMKLNSMEKESEERKETNLSLIEAEGEVEMDSLIARVKDGGRRRDLSSKRGGKGSRQDDSEIMAENEKAMRLNLMEKESEEREEMNLSLIEEEEEEEEEDEVEKELPIARVREKRMRREALKIDGLEDGKRRRDVSIKKGTLSKSSKKGKGPREDDLEIVAVESFDFYNFDKDRVERSFKKGQVWAVYDDDGMPRDYALIDEVISVHPFEVRLNWLEFQSNSDEALLHWGRMGFHISCGKFKVSRQALVKSLKRFSHIVDSERAARELYRIYPSKGSIWAVYKETALDEDKQCYDIVISLSSYTDMYGVSIAYLERVDGFKTIFKRREVGAHAVKLLGKDELRLFSHRIPASKLSDEEASNISKNCWELDHASLPRELLAITGGS
ncbi:uncharacterized protein LOC132058157 isoform X2 [Lycium ferocissimum]|uniref:uncharacterized protein LOC132058157 isoform X2 n=1 Tax=Lycium ferocissimum TaxID=112874 RepID=UPI002816061A|nr:uncharacterized protein LOC132058157 isoform X2 [Lycium ferocissimum]